MNADINPKIVHADLTPVPPLVDNKLFLHIDTGLNAQSTVEALRQYLARGQGVINFLASDVPCQLGMGPSENCQLSLPLSTTSDQRTALTFFINSQGKLCTGSEPDAHSVQLLAAGPIFTYDLQTVPNCKAILFLNQKTVGYQCSNKNGSFIQIGALIFDDYNSDSYGQILDFTERRLFMKSLMSSLLIVPQIQWSVGADKVVAFARKDPDQKLLWVTVKTGSMKHQSLQLKISQKLIHEGFSVLDKTQIFEVVDLMAQIKQNISLKNIIQKGFNVELELNGSTVFAIKPIYH